MDSWIHPPGDLFDGVTGGHLRTPLTICKPAGAALRCRPGGVALDAQPFEPGPVDCFERQRALEPRFGGGVERRSCPQRALAVELGAVALKAQGAPRTEPGSARSAHDLGAPAFQLSTWESYPRIFNGLQLLRTDVALHTGHCTPGV